MPGVGTWSLCPCLCSCWGEDALGEQDGGRCQRQELAARATRAPCALVATNQE